MRRARRRLAGVGLWATLGGAALGGVACLEAPSLDACYSAQDCPDEMACNAGVCETASTDGGPPDTPHRDAMAPPPDMRALDGPPDMPPPRPDTGAPPPDMAPPQSVICEASREDDGALRTEIVHVSDALGALRLDAVESDGRIAIVWQGPEPSLTRVACHQPGGETSDPYVYEGHEAAADRPAIARHPDRLVAAWIDIRAGGTDLVAQSFEPDCVTPLATNSVLSHGISGVQLAASRERVQVAARIAVDPRTGLGGLYSSALDALEPGVQPPEDLALRSLAMTDDGAGPVYAAATPVDAALDGVVAFRHGLFDDRVPLTEVGVTQAHVDGMAPIGGGAFVVGWSALDDTGAVTRRLTEVALDEVDPEVGADQAYTVGRGRLDAPPDLAYDPELTRTAVVTADEGTVRFWSLAPRDPQTPIVELEIALGRDPAIVVLGRGDYGVLYSTRLDGQTRLALTRVTCTAPVPE